MDPYSLVMSINGLLSLMGIFLFWQLARLVEKGRLGKGRLSPLLLAGGMTMALGFASHVVHSDVLPLLVLGSAMIIYSLSASGLVKAKLEMLLQIGLIVLSTSLGENLQSYLILIFSDLTLLLLMDAVAFYPNSPEIPASMARLSAWLFTVSVVVNSFSYRSLPALLLHTTSISLWITALLLAYPSTKLLTSAQEGL